MVAQTMSMRLAEYVHDLHRADIPDEVVGKAKHHLVQHLGLALQGGSTEDGRQAVRIAELLSPHGGPCTVFGTDRRANPLDAVLANCTLMRADGLDDVLFPVGVHAGLVTMPIALALGEQARLSGDDLITAIVAGYDLIGKVGRPLWGWSAAAPRRPTIAFGPFGSVAVAAKLLRLTVAQTAHAIGYAAHSAMGLAEGALVTHYYGLVARNGLTGTLLAREGGVASPTALEGRFGFYRTFFGNVPPGIEESLDTLGKTFEIMDATTKEYPGTGLNIVPIEVLLGLRRDHALDPANVARIRLYLPEERINFADGHSRGPFATAAAAASSAPFQLAAVLLDGAVSAARNQQYADERIRDIVDRTEVVFVTGRPIRYARLEVTTTDGTVVVGEGTDHTFAPVQWAGWLESCGAGVVRAERLRRLAGLVADLEHVDDVTDLIRCLAPDR
jgi:2-methylcitrate dehydratase PrpD